MLARREIVKGVAGLPLAAVLANPVLARAAADDLKKITITTTDGRRVDAALATPATTPAPMVILVHEWWGLNDQIKAVAAEFAQRGYLALAVDLYGGEVATTREEAGDLMRKVEAPAAVGTLVSWADWLNKHPKSNGKLGAVGWCFGGGWSLMTAMNVPIDATVVYYGNVARTADQLAAIKGPVLGHFATRDGWINQSMVDGFTAEMAKAGKDLTVHWYEADHAFANPSGARYDAADAKLAWQRTMAFFDEQLKGEAG